MSNVDLLRRVRTEIKNLDSDQYIKDNEGFIIDSCYSEESLMKLMDRLIESEKTKGIESTEDKVSAVKELNNLHDEITAIKKQQDCPNRDYYTGFLSALSIVEGLIAIRKGILMDKYKVFYTVQYTDKSKVSPVFDYIDDAIKEAEQKEEIVGILRNAVITENDVSIERVWTRES